MGVSALRRAQVAQETVKYTAQAALYRLVGMESDLMFEPEYDTIGGFMGGFARSSQWYITGRAGSGSLKGPLLRDVEGLIPFLFSMHEMAVVGAAAPYTYTFSNVFGDAPDIPTLTMEYGDNAEVLQGIGGVVAGWTLTGAVNKAVQTDVDLQFADVSTDLAGFTAIVTGTPDYSDASRRPPVVLTNNLHLLVDGVDTGVALIAFTFAFTSGVALDPRIDGTLGRNSQAYGVPEIEATFNVETGAKQAGFVTAMLAETAHIYSLQDDLVTPTFKLEWTGQPAAMGAIDDSNGVSNMQFTIRDVYRPDLMENPIEVTILTDAQSFA
jgi:hypothetical protein